jgi:hypothetical protein
VCHNQKVTIPSHFWAEKGVRVKKEDIVGKTSNPDYAMTVDEYMSMSKILMRFYIDAKLPLLYLELSISFQVILEWAQQHPEAWEELIRTRGLRENEVFVATVRQNTEIRGDGGTHYAGNRSFDRFKGKMVCMYIHGMTCINFP